MMFVRRFFIVASGCLLIATAAGGETPNIVYILADDMGFGDIRRLNYESKIPTPNLDRLVHQGKVFTEAHTPSGVCTPTRYGILTGRYSWRTDLQGVLNGFEPALIEPERMTVASLLNDNGYQTACVGKWHLGLGTETPVDYSKPLSPTPNTYGFDYSFIIPASLDMAPYLYLEDGVPVELPTGHVEHSGPRRDGGGGFWREGPIAPSFVFEDVMPTFMEKAVGFIERAAEEDDPFFLYLPLAGPHTPWMPTPAFQGTSEAGWYGDFVAQVDYTVGRVMDALERVDAADDTLLIFTSDNGAWWREQDTEEFGHAANYGRRGQKGDIYDGGHRVPFIARWPGKIEGTTESDEIICHTDLLATVAALIDVELPEDAGEDSYNVLPALLGQRLPESAKRNTGIRHPDDYYEPIREAVVHFSSMHMTAIRKGRWKLIFGLGSGGFTQPPFVEPEPDGPQGQLYDMEADPMETTNLWSEHPEIVAELTALLEKYKEDGRSAPRVSRRDAEGAE